MSIFGKKVENEIFFEMCDHGSHFILCVCMCVCERERERDRMECPIVSFCFESQGWLCGHMEAIWCSGHGGQLCRLSSSLQSNPNYETRSEHQ